MPISHFMQLMIFAEPKFKFLLACNHLNLGCAQKPQVQRGCYCKMTVGMLCWSAGKPAKKFIAECAIRMGDLIRTLKSPGAPSLKWKTGFLFPAPTFCLFSCCHELTNFPLPCHPSWCFRLLDPADNGQNPLNHESNEVSLPLRCRCLLFCPRFKKVENAIPKLEAYPIY